MSAKKKKNVFLEFMTTLPGLLTALATIITAIAGMYIAFKPDIQNPSPRPIATSSPTTGSPLIDVVRGQAQVRLTDRIAIQLLDVDTLKGKSKKDEPPSHEFNKTLDDRDHVFREVLSRSGVNGYSVESILDMNQEKWESFLEALDDKQREKVKETPFAKFNVYIDDKQDVTYTKKFYFQGEPLTVRVGDQNITIEIVDILNTKSSVAPESVKVKLR